MNFIRLTNLYFVSLYAGSFFVLHARFIESGNILFFIRTRSSDKFETLGEKSDPSIVEPAVVNVYEEDLKMRAAMYGVLFQAFADQVVFSNVKNLMAVHF